MAYRGKYKPKNPEKCMGNPSKIIYRSLLERNLMKFCDMNDSVLEWGSENVIVPYISPLDKKPHRYFVDFLIKFKKKDGTIETWLVEVKPYKQTKPPKPPEKRTSRKYLRECTTYAVNEAKWEAAIEYAKKRGWIFKIMTERILK